MRAAHDARLTAFLDADGAFFSVTALAGFKIKTPAVQCADKVVAIDFGKKIASGLPDEVMANPQVRKAYLGEDDAPATETQFAGEVA